MSKLSDEQLKELRELMETKQRAPHILTFVNALDDALDHIDALTAENAELQQRLITTDELCDEQVVFKCPECGHAIRDGQCACTADQLRNICRRRREVVKTLTAELAKALERIERCGHSRGCLSRNAWTLGPCNCGKEEG